MWMLPVATAIQHLSSRSAIALSLHNNKKSFSSAVDHMFRFAFVGVLIIHERIKKQIKLKSLRIDGNPRKRKRVEICNTFSLPVAYQSAVGQAKFSRQKLTHASYAFASYLRREGHLYDVFLRTGVKGCSKIRRVLAELLPWLFTEPISFLTFLLSSPS